jgi:hypothetical protein
MSSPITLWFQRKNTGDFRVTIRLDKNGFAVNVLDMYQNDTYENNVTLETLDDLYRYIEILCGQVLNDRDPHNPFTHFQYCVPNFPCVIDSIDMLNDEEFYGRFCEAVDFYWGDI